VTPAVCAVGGGAGVARGYLCRCVAGAEEEGKGCKAAEEEAEEAEAEQPRRPK